MPNLMKYDIVCPLKVVNRYKVDILLYLSIGIFSLNRMVFALNRIYEPTKYQVGFDLVISAPNEKALIFSVMPKWHKVRLLHDRITDG